MDALKLSGQAKKQNIIGTAAVTAAQLLMFSCRKSSQTCLRGDCGHVL
jgi:hypothetical protein